MTCRCKNSLENWKEFNKYELFILFYSILFYSILLYSILFYCILLYSIVFYSILFYSILFYSILFYSILFYSILLYSILFYSIQVLNLLAYQGCHYSILGRHFGDETIEGTHTQLTIIPYPLHNRTRLFYSADHPLFYCADCGHCYYCIH